MVYFITNWFKPEFSGSFLGVLPIHEAMLRHVDFKFWQLDLLNSILHWVKLSLSRRFACLCPS